MIALKGRQVDLESWNCQLCKDFWRYSSNVIIKLGYLLKLTFKLIYNYLKDIVPLFYWNTSGSTKIDIFFSSRTNSGCIYVIFMLPHHLERVYAKENNEVTWRNLTFEVTFAKYSNKFVVALFSQHMKRIARFGTNCTI